MRRKANTLKRHPESENGLGLEQQERLLCTLKAMPK